MIGSRQEVQALVLSPALFPQRQRWRDVGRDQSVGREVQAARPPQSQRGRLAGDRRCRQQPRPGALDRRKLQESDQKGETRYEREKAAGLSSWIFFKRLDKLLRPASDAEDVWELWELEEAVMETAGPVAELARKLRGFEAQMKELTGRGSDELVQALDRLEQAWSGFAASVADAAAAEDDSSKTEEDLGANGWSGDQDDPVDGAAGR
uniref:Uncharacterized protein n=1 Tax=Ananas comosus var. bracteatus TaxID=296719 RepID=A0A6V7P5L6_ANACO|nr:unnamed protein product [Ananas comosus var. bracteatus]